MPQPKLHASAAARQAAYRKRCEQERRIERLSKGLPPLPAIPTMPGWARWNTALRLAQDLIERTQVEMEQYFDDRSETWQESERGEEHQNAINIVQGTVEAMSDLLLI
jgi:hypothetical protein